MIGPLRIGCVGGESSGKTTLAHALGMLLPANLVNEELRAFVEAHGRPPRQDEQSAVMTAQRAREDQARIEHPDSTLICDPATLMTAVYSALYFDDDSLQPTAMAWAREYDALLWCRPDIPWVAEPGQHDGPQFRERADRILAVWLAGLPQGLVLEISGAHGRIELAQQRLRDRFGCVWQSADTGQPT